MGHCTLYWPATGERLELGDVPPHEREIEVVDAEQADPYSAPNGGIGSQTVKA